MKPGHIVLFSVAVAAIFFLFLLLFQGPVDIVPRVEPVNYVSQKYVISEATPSLEYVSFVKELQKESVEKYNTYRMIADREKRETERKVEFERQMKGEREIRERLLQEKLKKT